MKTPLQEAITATKDKIKVCDYHISDAKVRGDKVMLQAANVAKMVNENTIELLTGLLQYEQKVIGDAYISGRANSQNGCSGPEGYFTQHYPDAKD